MPISKEHNFINYFATTPQNAMHIVQTKTVR